MMFFYGPSTLSLITGLSKLSNVANTGPSDLPVSTATQTALNNKLNIANPTYTGMLSNANSNFQVDNTGNVNCYDVKYNGGISLITSFSKLSNVANTAPSDLPVSTATQTALNNQMTILTNITAQRMTSTNPIFIGNLSGNDGFQIDSSNNLRASGWISCQSFFCAGDVQLNSTTSVANSLNTLNNLRTSGTLTATTTFQTIYTLTSGTQGILTACSGSGSYPCMMAAFFQWRNGSTYPSLTQIASSGNVVQSGLSTTNVGTGTQYISLQITSSGTPVIQLKTTTGSFTVKWYITHL